MWRQACKQLYWTWQPGIRSDFVLAAEEYGDDGRVSGHYVEG